MALGTKRSASLFAANAEKRDALEFHDSPELDVVPVVVDDTPQRTLNTDASTVGRAHNLFFTPETEGKDFGSVLQEVQEYISGSYSSLISQGGEDAKEQLQRYITKYLQDQRIAVAGMTQTELADAIYSEMAEYGFLTSYIYGDGIEEININSWRDIEVQYSDGRNEKLEEHFDSPEHALAVIRRMLHASGMVLDNASPLVTGHLTRNTRIAAMKSPVVDEDVGVAASIRIVNRHNLSREDLLRSGTATEEMLDWLSVFLRYGISICVAGATSSGKTTAAGWLLTTIPDSKRIFTIENGSRELELVREENGKVVNSVVHTLTRDSENERQRIDQIALVDICLRFNPDTKRHWCASRVLSQHISFLKDFFRAYKDFSDAHIDTIEIMLSKLYQKWGITDRSNFVRMRAEDYPTLSDLYDLIEDEFKNYHAETHQLYTKNLLQEVLLGLHSMCKGADAQFFNGHTNITSSRFLVFGVKGLLSAAKNVRNAMLFNVLSYLSDKLLTEGNTVAALDELYIWLSNPTAIEYIRNCLKRVRKKESAMLLASQNLEDFDQEGIREMTKPLFSIPPHQFLFNAGSIDKRSYMEMLQLDEAEYNLIKFPQRGVCLYKCGNERYLLEVHAPTYKEKLFGTAGGR